MLLTVQVDVVGFTPVTPQWRFIQAGAVNLDGVVQSGLQIQKHPGLSGCRNNLTTAQRKQTLTQTDLSILGHVVMRAMTQNLSSFVVSSTVTVTKTQNQTVSITG